MNASSVKSGCPKDKHTKKKNRHAPIDCSSDSDASHVGHHGGRGRRGKDARKKRQIRKIIIQQRIVACLMVLVGVAIIGVSAIAGASALYPRSAFTDFTPAMPALLFEVPALWVLAAAILSSIITRVYFGFADAGIRYAKAVLDYHNDGYSHHMARHVNQYRWCFFGVYQSLMLVALALLAGVTNIFLHIGIVAANCGLQWCAFVLERDNHSAPDSRAVRLAAMVFGFLLWAFIQGTIISYFLLSTLTGASGVTGPLWPLYVAIIGFALLQAMCGILAFMRYTSTDSSYTDNRYVERLYLAIEVLMALVTVAPLLIAAF